MKTVIVGGVAGGMSCATRLRRLDETAEIIVLERGEHVSFANCGLPYYAGGVIGDRDELLLQTPATLKERFNLDVRIKHEVISIDEKNKTIQVKNLDNNNIESIQYDNLVLSLGASPVIPPMEGAEKLFTLRNIYDVDKLVEKIALSKNNKSKAVVIGAGFIGLELAENLVKQGLQVSIVEMAPQVLPALNPEMSSYVAQELIDNGVELELGVSVQSVGDDEVVLSDGRRIEADLVFASIGVRPEISILKEAGIEIGSKGGVVVDGAMKTSVDNIYAVGDMVEKIDFLTKESGLVALANLANKQGRRAADSICNIKYNENSNNALGTAVVKVFDLTVAMTGMSSRRLTQMDREFISIHTHPNDHASYYPGAIQMHIVTHVDALSGELLGAQAVGPHDAVRKIDVLATAIAGKINAVELIDLELAYSPQYSSAKDAINMIGYIADGILNANDRVVEANQLDNKVIVDVRTEEEFNEGSIPGAINIPLDDIRDRYVELEKNSGIIVYCQVGQRGHTAQRLLKQLGFAVSNLDGGYLTWEAFNFASNIIVPQK